jgi:deoxyribodipyrimidine photo-lyase
MRQLSNDGWLHTRARMVAASFLTKNLLIDWRWGAKWFLEHLIDGDLAANTEGWQRAAGVGTGAAPYLSILNPTLQGIRYDPDGSYVRHWLPELAQVPVEHIHRPWLMPGKIQQASGCVIGRDYPEPVLDYAWARDRAIEFFRLEPAREGARP